MKTNINTRFACIITAMMLVTYSTFAQQPHSKPGNTPIQISGSVIAATYTYKIFQAPNKMYGFDIFKNNKFVFHQPASSVPSSNYHPALTTTKDAEKAAQLSIDKLKKKRQPSMLTNDEMKKIVSQ
jgi:hypothetical protein